MNENEINGFSNSFRTFSFFRSSHSNLGRYFYPYSILQSDTISHYLNYMCCSKYNHLNDKLYIINWLIITFIIFNTFNLKLYTFVQMYVLLYIFLEICKYMYDIKC